MIKKFRIWLLASMWRYLSRKQCQIILDFISIGNDKKKMIALIKELHQKNDGSYKSSNSNLWLYLPCGHFRVQHQHGYVSIAYCGNGQYAWKMYLTTKENYHIEELIDFKEEAALKLYPDSFERYWAD